MCVILPFFRRRGFIFTLYSQKQKREKREEEKKKEHTHTQSMSGDNFMKPEAIAPKVDEESLPLLLQVIRDK